MEGKSSTQRRLNVLADYHILNDNSHEKSLDQPIWFKTPNMDSWQEGTAIYQLSKDIFIIRHRPQRNSYKRMPSKKSHGQRLRLYRTFSHQYYFYTSNHSTPRYNPTFHTSPTALSHFHPSGEVGRKKRIQKYKSAHSSSQSSK